MMTVLLSVASVAIVLVSILVLTALGRAQLKGSSPVSPLVMAAILFTSGLDVGLIMFPLTEFPIYADTLANPEYAFANPLAIAFGFWGGLVWLIYFVTCFYFCYYEPKLKLFQMPWLKYLNNVLIIGTCAFTGHLLLQNLPWYLPIEGQYSTSIYWVIVSVIVVLAVLSSTKLSYLKVLSVGSVLLFAMLIVAMVTGAIVYFDMAAHLLWRNSTQLVQYFQNLSEFVLPINAYHEFYLFWWFAWSIMIGQFVAQFVRNLKPYQLLMAMLVLPSLTIGVWFTVLYSYYDAGIETQGIINTSMATVGLIFVINSLDSLIRLYTSHLSWTTVKLGRPAYLVMNTSILLGLIVLFELQWLHIQWIGTVVILVLTFCFVRVIQFHIQGKASFTSKRRGS